MSYLLDTALLAYQSKEAQTELKKPKHGVIPFVLNQSKDVQISPDTIQKIKTANGQSIDISAIKEMTPAVTNSFSYDLEANRSETAKTRITIYTYWTSFYFNKYDFANQAITPDQYFMNKVIECDKSLSSAVSTDLISNLDTRKSQVMDDTGLPSGVTFNTSADAVKITKAAQAKPFFTYLNTLLDQNNLDGARSLVSTQTLGYAIADHSIYGKYNEKDLMGQLIPSYYGESNLAATTDSDATAYMVRNGAIGLFPTIPAEFAAGDNSVPGVKFSVGGLALPMTGLKPLVLEIDATYQGNGLTSRPTDNMTVTKKIGVGVSFGVVNSYNSDLASNVNDVVKVELLTD